MKKFKNLIFLLLIIYLVSILYRSIIFYLSGPLYNKNAMNTLEYYYYFRFCKNKCNIIKYNKWLKQDNKGVFIIDYSKMDSLGVKNQISYNPISIALFGLAYLQKYLIYKDPKALKIAIVNAKWLLNHQDSNGRWLTYHDKSFGKYLLLKSPWPSAMGQGLAISFLTRMYKLTNDPIYLYSAKRALKPFELSIEKGGVKSNNEFGIFYEEYPLDNNNSFHVLNGFNFSLIGLYDLYRFTGDKKAKKLFDKGIYSLIKILPMYDKCYWSLYSLNKISNFKNHYNLASPSYHKLHALQLKILFDFTKEITLSKYSNKFKKEAKYSPINFILIPLYIIYKDVIPIYRFLLELKK